MRGSECRPAKTAMKYLVLLAAMFLFDRSRNRNQDQTDSDDYNESGDNSDKTWGGWHKWLLFKLPGTLPVKYRASAEHMPPVAR
ncbi:MAG: hypothetical protein FWD62_07435 [Betaproteobacteria bacterium]|nr:hypothetical protein [Betaproteobacteria bacterium]